VLLGSRSGSGRSSGSGSNSGSGSGGAVESLCGQTVRGGSGSCIGIGIGSGNDNVSLLVMGPQSLKFKLEAKCKANYHILV
jgi:hypothetical protein